MGESRRRPPCRRATLAVAAAVVGVRLVGDPPRVEAATDFVLTMRSSCAARRVVGASSCSAGVDHVSLRTGQPSQACSRKSISAAQSSPSTRRPSVTSSSPAAHRSQIALVEAYAKEQILRDEPGPPIRSSPSPSRSDLGTVVPSVAGPARPHDRVRSSSQEGRSGWRWPAGPRSTTGARSLAPADRTRPPPSLAGQRSPASNAADRNPTGPTDAPERRRRRLRRARRDAYRPSRPTTAVSRVGSRSRSTTANRDRRHTSCHEHVNPSVMVAAGLLWHEGGGPGLRSKPWVKTSCSSSSLIILRKQGWRNGSRHRASICSATCTCIGNSGPLHGASHACWSRDWSRCRAVLRETGTSTTQSPHVPYEPSGLAAAQSLPMPRPDPRHLPDASDEGRTHGPVAFPARHLADLGPK